MNLSLHIAGRYLKGKKSHNAINIISIISVVGVTIGTFALIVVLSVFNGFEHLVVSLYNSFDPDFKITLAEGKFISLNDDKIKRISQMEGVDLVVPTLEENALLKYKDKQYIITAKGVPNEFRKLTKIDSVIFEGSFKYRESDANFTVLGGGVAYNLALKLNDLENPVMLYLPKREKGYSADPQDAFSTTPVFPTGLFAIQQEFDSKFVLVNLAMMQQMLELPNHCSALEIGIKEGWAPEAIQTKLQGFLGKDYLIKSRYQQHELLYKIMKSEKWAVFLILSFILIIATFNVIGSLTMLIIEKKHDIEILKSLGARTVLIQKIFLAEGLLITVIGAATGLLLGFVVCWLQQTFGIIKLGGTGTFVIDAYPVFMEGMDFITVFGTVFFIGFIAALIPAKQILKNER